jgi:hypothetical protein
MVIGGLIFLGFGLAAPIKGLRLLELGRFYGTDASINCSAFAFLIECAGHMRTR